VSQTKPANHNFLSIHNAFNAMYNVRYFSRDCSHKSDQIWPMNTALAMSAPNLAERWLQQFALLELCKKTRPTTAHRHCICYFIVP